MRDQQREEFMKRKVEQLAALQQQQRQNLSSRGSSRLDDRRRALPLGIAKKTYSPGAAKNKWKTLEKKVEICIRARINSFV
jgi:hypothetical protein